MALLLPIKTMSALPSKDEPPGVCPECEQEGAEEEGIPEKRGSVEYFRRRLKEDSPQGDIFREMRDMTRGLMGLPPLRDEESEPPKDN